MTLDLILELDHASYGELCLDGDPEDTIVSRLISTVLLYA